MWKKLCAVWLIVCLLLATSLVLPQEAKAVLFVEDVVAIAEAVLQTFYIIADYAIQVEMIANAILQYETMILNLNPLDWPIIGELWAAVGTAFAIFERGKGLVHEFEDFSPQFIVLYPKFGEGRVGGEVFIEQQYTWNLQVREANQAAGEAQAIKEALETSMAVLEGAMHRSDRAVGNLQVMQAGNQINGVVATELIRMQQLLAMQGRAQMSKDMKEAAIDNEALANANHAMECFTCMDETIEGLRTLPQIRY